MHEDQSTNSMEGALRERMAMLEATNNYHQESLKEISASLKEVVKTQHILANQKDEIVKLVDGLRQLNEEVTELKSYRESQGVRDEVTQDKIVDLQKQVTSLAADVDNNSHFVKMVTKVGGAIIAPLIVAQLMQIFGT